MARTRESLLEEAQRLGNAIDGGKFKTKSGRYAAQLRMYRLRYRAKKARPAGAPKQLKAKSPVKNQGFIPGFLSGLDHVRIEEIIADKIFKKIEKTVDEKLEAMFKVG